jgi:hypothetical protein
VILRGVLLSRLRMARNLVWPPRRRGARAGRWQVVIGIAIFASFFALAFGAVTATLAHLAAQGLGVDRAGAALAIVLTGALAGVLVFDLHYAVSALLLDSDLELLRRVPLSPASLLAIKLLDSLPRTAALVAGVALPACLGFAAVHGVPPWGWALLAGLLGGLWATPLGVGLAGALLLVRVVPASRAREVLAVFSTLVLLGLWLVNSFVAPRLLDEEGEMARRLGETLGAPPPLAAFSPAHWAAQAWVAAHRGAALEAVGWASLLVLAGLVSLGLGALAARLLLDETLARLSAGGPVRAGRRAARRPGSAGVRLRGEPAAQPSAGGRTARGELRALVLKDARLFVRDWAVLGDVLTAAALWTLLPLVGTPLYRTEPALLARFMLVALAVGLGYEVGARVVPYEGPALAWCRLAPVSAWRWNLAKLLAGGLISAPLLVLAALVVRAALPLGWSAWGEALAAGGGALLLSLSLGLWTGWTFGDPRWTNPRAMLTLSGRLVASALLIAQAGIWLGFLAWADFASGDRTWALHAWGPLALGALLALPLIGLAVRAARRLEWPA